MSEKENPVRVVDLDGVRRSYPSHEAMAKYWINNRAEYSRRFSAYLRMTEQERTALYSKTWTTRNGKDN